MADVFNASVYTTESTDSAALGGCYRAIHGMKLYLLKYYSKTPNFFLNEKF